jgi:gliding motility-associated-like protein
MNDTLPSLVVSPALTTTYIRSTWVPDTTHELITNGNFEAGNTAFTSTYDYKTGHYSMNPEATYTVSDDPSFFHTDWSPCVDHTSGNGMMMIVNGDSTGYTSIWSETVANFQPGATYAFSAWLQNVLKYVTDPLRWPLLQFSINGSPLGDLMQTTNDNCQWLQFYVLWPSGTNTSATINIVNRHLDPKGNDFALDDISFAPLIAIKDTFVVIIKPYPVVNLGPDRVVPYNGSITLDAQNPGAVYSWSTGETTQTISINNVIKNMIISVIVDQNGCLSSDEINIGVDCAEILVPNVFAPDKPPDNEIKVFGAGIDNLDFMIFNRQGEMVFRTRDRGIGWDGTYKGIAQPMDVYMYYLKAQCLSGGTVEKKGDITLIR